MTNLNYPYVFFHKAGLDFINKKNPWGNLSGHFIMHIMWLLSKHLSQELTSEEFYANKSTVKVVQVNQSIMRYISFTERLIPIS